MASAVLRESSRPLAKALTVESQPSCNSRYADLDEVLRMGHQPAH
jgi:hypothetical protein